MREEELLINRLDKYRKAEVYPFHMPGHKRLEGFWEGFEFPNPFLVDITEIEGFDNLHHAEGILKQSMEWAAGVYGADRTYYLVNGSSGGILAAVCGCVRTGGRILMSRNCHKSAYNGVYLNRLKPVYVYPQNIPGLGVQGGISAEDVGKCFQEYEDIQAVLVVSPTYDGVVSDIRAIAEAVHGVGLPLIVDEAHGAHFRYLEEFPQSALELGADVVIQSVHKTLPSLTQTALLHIKCNRPDGGFYGDMEAIDRYLHIYQSSSPSYVFMASIENAVFQMEKVNEEGAMREQCGRYLKALKGLRGRLKAELKRLELVDTSIIGANGVFDLDISKIVVSTRKAGVGGGWLEQRLREKFQLEMEMCGADYVTAITSVMDSPEGLERLGDALLGIDERLGEAGGLAKGVESRLGCIYGSVEFNSGNRLENMTDCTYSRTNQAIMTISEAMEAPFCTVPLTACANCISAEFIYIFPPGIPIVAPGERISEAVLATVQEYIKNALPVQGLADETLATLRIVETG